MLKRFFANFSDDIESELKKRFLSLWSHFGDIYHDYNRRLTEQGIGYEGAIYRKVASEETLHLKYDKYLFVGFNLIQKVERVLFSRLMKEGKAKFYWDFDEYYMPTARAQQSASVPNNTASFAAYLTSSTTPTTTSTPTCADRNEYASYPRPRRMRRHASRATGFLRTTATRLAARLPS